jgi:molecular chaperone DnaK (HSP70)
VIRSGILVPTAEPSTFSISISQKNKSQNSSKRLSERLCEHDSGPTNKAKEPIELRNNADNLAYQCEKQLKDLGDKLDEATKKSVEDAVAKVPEALKGNDNDAVKSAFDDSRPNSKGSVRSSTRRPPRRLVPSAAPQKVPPLEPKARRRTQMS